MPRSFRRVAALYDIHGNLPALDAVLEHVRAAAVDLIVVGGDVVPGPMPREALERLLGLDLPVRFIHGNCELAVLAQLEVDDAMRATYWGSASGRPLGEACAQGMRWSALQVADHRDLIASWPRTLRIVIDGMGVVLFCHATPRSETEIFTCRTSEERLRPVFDGLGVGTVICGHTHMQFDRVVGSTRVINAGSVGMPIGDRGAFWLLLGPDAVLKHTAYDLVAAAELVRAVSYPQAQADAAAIVQPPRADEMLDLYATAELQ